MDTIYSFIDTNQRELIQIYISERASRGDGVLMISNNIAANKIDCIYLENTQMPVELLEELNHRREDDLHRTDIIYFYLCTPDDSSLIAINLR